MLCSTRAEDHPRVCGKDVGDAVQIVDTTGSPPRMRERLVYYRVVEGAVGITPAYAGKTVRRGCVKWSRRDHPRVCGKDSTKPDSKSRSKGSPPRMRERRISLCVLCILRRITPAYAGKTHSIVRGFGR